MRNAATIGLALGVFVSFGAAARPAEARDVPCGPVDDGVIAVDGLLGDWNDVAATTVTDGERSLAVRCNYTATTLFFALAVHGAGTGDRAELVFAASEAGPLARLVVMPGARKAEWEGAWPAGKHTGKSVVVRTAGGLVVEASLPRSEVPGDAPTTAALPFAALLLHGKTALSTSVAMPPERPLDRLALAGGAQNLQAFLAQVGARPEDITWDHVAHVTEDAGLQRVVLAGRHLGILGANDYLYADLPAASPSDVTGVDLVDLSGDGRAWVVVRYTERGDGGARDVLAAYRTSADALLRPFAHEVEKRVGDRIIMDRWQYVLRAGGGRDLVISAEPATGFTADTYQEAPATDVSPILLPWGPAKSERWRFTGDAAALVE